MSRINMNPSNRRSRRRRSPRPFALLLIIGGAALLGYNLWPADGSNLLQAEPKAEAKSKPQVKPTRVPSTVAVNDQTPATEPVVEKPTEASTPKALPEVVEVQSPEPTPPANVPTNPVTPVESNSDAPRPYGNVLSPTLRPACGCCEMGWSVEGRQRLSDALGSGGLDYARASEVREELSQLSETLVFGSGVAQRDPFAREFIIPEGGVLAKIAQNQTNGLHWKFWHESMGSPVQIAFDLANA